MCCPTLGAYCSTIGNHSDSWQLHQHLSAKSVAVPWTIPESYPAWQLDHLISSFDPLAIHAVEQLFNPLQPGPSPDHNSEAQELGSAITATLPPNLSPVERCHYESVVGSSNLGAYLAPVENNSIPIVIDTGSSRSILPLRADLPHSRS